jgi:hypothetical protein
MKLSWSLCPYCGTPEPGKRIEDLTVAQAARSVEIQEDEEWTPEEEGEGELEQDDTHELDQLSDEDLINQL